MLNYVNRAIVGTAAGTGDGTLALSALGRGDVSIFAADDFTTPLADGAAKQPFYIAVGTGDTASPFILSSKIDPDNAFMAIKDARPADDQVSSVSVAAPTVGDSVNVIIAFKDRQRLIANKQTRIVLSHEATTAVAYDLASALAKQAQFSSPYSDPYGVKVEVTTAGTDSVTEVGNTISVTKGSDRISFSVAAQHGTDQNYAVGDYIDISGVTYSVTEVVSATVLKLDRLYTGDTAALANTAVNERSTLTATNIRVTGVAAPYNNPEIDIYEKPTFELASDQAGAVVTNTTAMDLGQGTYEQVKKLEFDVQGYLGNTNLRQWPIPVFDYHATSGVSYDIINIMGQDEHEGDLQNQMKSPVGAVLAFNAGTTTQRDAIFAILEDVMGRANELSFA
jgi:hypothetical protein